jgi:hypothetical protein
VEEHHGHMNIVSKPGQGTVVTLSFPLEHMPLRYLAGDHPTAELVMRPEISQDE